MSYNIITESNPIKTDKQITGLRKEMEDYAKCMKGNQERIKALTFIGVCAGHWIDPEVCDVVPKETMIKIANDLAYRIYMGTNVNGTLNNWNVGFMGSRWLDMDGEIYGVDSIRASFYSKKHYGMRSNEKWPYDEPYAIQIMVEKEKK
jgi:hypothetical protein